MAEVRIKTPNGNNHVSLATANLSGDVTVTLPKASIDLSTAGTDGQFLKTNGAGTLSFATVDTTPEGTAIKSTTNSNEAATKFLRADGDGTCSWQIPAGKVFDIKVDEYGGGNTTITTNDWTDTGHSITIGGSGGTKILLFLAAQISNSYSTNIIPAYGIKMNDNSNTSGAFVWRQNQYDAGGQNMVNLIDWHTTSTSQTFKVRGYQSGGTNTQYLTGATLVAVEV